MKAGGPHAEPAGLDAAFPAFRSPRPALRRTPGYRRAWPSL